MRPKTLSLPTSLLLLVSVKSRLGLRHEASVLPNITRCSASSTFKHLLLVFSFTDFFHREELEGTGATYAGDKGLSAGANPPALLK